MPRAYNLAGNVTVGADKTAVHIVPTTAIRPAIYEFIIGCQSTPAAQAAYWTFQRSSAAGTGTGVTPTIFDPANPASLCTGTANHSAEPTYAGGSCITIGLNQQGTFNWKANPGLEIVLPASGTAGGGMKTSTSTGTALHAVSMMWIE